MKKQTNKQNLLPPTLPIPLVTENCFIFPTPRFNSTPPPPSPWLKGSIKSGKMSKSFGLQTFSTCCHFFMYILYFFSLSVEFFPLCF